MPAPIKKREFDIIVYGATSFTGVRCLQYISKNQKTSLQNLKIAIAGRNQSKVEEAGKNNGCPNLPVVVADTSDATALDAMCARTSVLLSFAGPYSLYGMPVVDACVRNSCNFVDITGEFPFVARVAEKYHEEAVSKKIFLLSCCAFDSIPAEIANFLAHRTAKDKGIELKHVKVAWTIKGSAGMSGGTAHSAAGIIPTIKARDLQPLSMLPQEQQQKSDLQPFINVPGGFPNQKWVNWNNHFDAYLCPFFMAGVNSKVVRKSNVLMHFNSSYHEVLLVKSYLAGLMTVVLGLAVYLLAVPIVGTLIKNYLLPKPGTGPDPKDEATQTFMTQALGYRNSDGSGEPVIRVKCDFPHAAYPVSALMAMETAAAVALGEFNPEVTSDKNTSWNGGGAVTPVAVVGDSLVRRLAHANITCSTSTESSWENMVKK